MDIHAVVEDKLNNDTEFHSSLEGLADEDRSNAINQRRTELINQEVSSLAEAKKKAEQIAADQKRRAEKAEEEAKKSHTIQPTQNEGLSDDDLLYVARAPIHQDDVKDVVELAKLKKIPVAEAHKFMEPILERRSEERKTAEAAHTKGSARGTITDTPESLIAKAQQGNLSEAEIDKLVEAEMALKVAGMQK